MPHPRTADENVASWPDQANPGVPLMADTHSYHWAISYKGGGTPVVMQWDKRQQTFAGHRGMEAATRYFYLGPCRTPEEIASMREDAIREAIEVILAKKSDHPPSQAAYFPKGLWETACDILAEGLRAPSK